LARNVIAIVIWGFYIILVLVLLKVPQTGISVVAAGLATGMGFAMKDLLENFFYGISLMSGRLRVGDYIECDGIQGKVESITYQSTQIITLDGSVIAFLNTSLFNKNFKNLTRNHSYELVKIPVGIAYGNNIQQVRKMLLDAIKPLCVVLPDGRDVVNKEKSISVLFSDFGDSSVNLIVAMWILVDQKPTFMAQVKETIYDTLNKNNIEIPFPQHDVYLHTIANDSDK
jgi:small-conductance mechanosensitive channel